MINRGARDLPSSLPLKRPVLIMSSLSQVVSTLLRASMGSAVSSNVADEDLDRHVAEIILKEAKEKAVRYDKDGIRAYLQNTNS
jgi:hypothetical protein